MINGVVVVVAVVSKIQLSDCHTASVKIFTLTVRIAIKFLRGWVFFVLLFVCGGACVGGCMRACVCVHGWVRACVRACVCVFNNCVHEIYKPELVIQPRSAKEHVQISLCIRIRLTIRSIHKKCNFLFYCCCYYYYYYYYYYNYYYYYYRGCYAWYGRRWLCWCKK